MNPKKSATNTITDMTMIMTRLFFFSILNYASKKIFAGCKNGPEQRVPQAADIKRVSRAGEHTPGIVPIFKRTALEDTCNPLITILQQQTETLSELNDIDIEVQNFIFFKCFWG